MGNLSQSMLIHMNCHLNIQNNFSFIVPCIYELLQSSNRQQWSESGIIIKH